MLPQYEHTVTGVLLFYFQFNTTSDLSPVLSPAQIQVDGECGKCSQSKQKGSLRNYVFSVKCGTVNCEYVSQISLKF